MWEAEVKNIHVCLFKRHKRGHTSVGAWPPGPSSTRALPSGTQTPEAPDHPSQAQP